MQLIKGTLEMQITETEDKKPVAALILSFITKVREAKMLTKRAENLYHKHAHSIQQTCCSSPAPMRDQSDSLQKCLQSSTTSSHFYTSWS